MDNHQISEEVPKDELYQSLNQEASTYTFSHISERDNPELHPRSPITQTFKHQSSPAPYDHQIGQINQQRLNKSKEQPRTCQYSPNHKYSNTTYTATEDVVRPLAFKEECEQEQGENSYRLLTLKLQTALNKISVVGGKGLSKSVSQSNGIWQRSELCAQRKRRQLERKRDQIEQLKVRELRTKPLIDKQSQRIALEIGHEPIHLRADKLVAAKKKKLQEMEQSKRRAKEEEQAQYMQELNRCMRRPVNVRSYGQYFQEMVRWKDKATARNRQKQEEQQNKEMETATFKPALNQKSRQIAEGVSRVPIDQRGLVRKKTKPQYSFSPQVGRTSKRR